MKHEVACGILAVCPALHLCSADREPSQGAAFPSTTESAASNQQALREMSWPHRRRRVPAWQVWWFTNSWTKHRDRATDLRARSRVDDAMQSRKLHYKQTTNHQRPSAITVHVFFHCEPHRELEKQLSTQWWTKQGCRSAAGWCDMVPHHRRCWEPCPEHLPQYLQLRISEWSVLDQQYTAYANRWDGQHHLLWEPDLYSPAWRLRQQQWTAERESHQMFSCKRRCCLHSRCSAGRQPWHSVRDELTTLLRNMQRRMLMIWLSAD